MGCKGKSTLGVIAVLLFVPASDARGATSCVFDSDPPGVMDINMASAGDGASIQKSGAAITVTGAGLVNVPCPDGTTQPTVDNVAEIHVHDGSSGNTQVTIGQPAGFAPTSQPNPLDPKEIEFDLDFNGTDDTLALQGAGTTDNFRAGDSGIDVNAGSEPVNFDSDITFSGTDPFLSVILQGGSDVFTGQGVSIIGDSPIAYNSQISGGPGDDTITGGAGQDTLTGEAENDTLDGATGTPGSLTGGEGDDTLESGSGNSTLNGGNGSDTVRYSSASGPVEAVVNLVGGQMTGGSGTDTFTSIENLTGSPFNDFLTGDGNANTLNGAGQTGGVGDFVDYGNAGAGVTVSLAETAPQDTVGAGVDTLSGFESIQGSPSADTLGGDDGNNTLTAGPGGIDRVSYAHASSGVSVRLETTTAQDTGAAGTDTLTGFENLTGSAFDDDLEGSLGLNSIDGLEGNDTLDGGANGNDDMDGGDGKDTVSYESCGDLTCSAGMVVDLDSQLVVDTLGTPYGALTSIENATGSFYDDELIGSPGRNVLDAAEGNDVVTGGDGKDQLFGRDGLDKLKAKDGRKDKAIDCGPGANAQESAKFDKDKDPKPKSC